MIKKSAVVTLSLVLLACAGAKTYQGVPLIWKPTSELNVLSRPTPTGVVVSIKPFTDSRKNKSEIGRNIEDTQHIKTVTTKDNVAAWSTEQFSDLIRRHGFSVSQNGNVILMGDVIDFYVDEDNTYKSRVSVKLKAVNSSGDSLWEGVMSGSATRYGRSYSLENFYETLSDAMIDAVTELLQKTNFTDSLKASDAQDTDVNPPQVNAAKKLKKRSNQ